MGTVWAARRTCRRERAAAAGDGEGLTWSGEQASSASRARRVVLAGGLLLALATVATVAMVGGEAAKTGHVRMELSDRNEFEAQPAWDQDWDLKDIQHHLVRTQRMQTAHNKKFVADIQRLDMDIEDLMKQVKKPGPTGPAGPPGKDGAPGPAHSCIHCSVVPTGPPCPAS